MAKLPRKPEKRKMKRSSLRNSSKEIKFNSMEDATNTIKKICGRYSLTYHSSTIFNKKAKVSNKKFPKTKEKKKNNIWIVFYPDMKRNCWLFKSIGGNKFVAACKKVVAFYIPAGYEYLIEAATDAFFMVITERE